jgi:hypothetical protein
MQEQGQERKKGILNKMFFIQGLMDPFWKHYIQSYNNQYNTSVHINGHRFYTQP